MKIKKGTEVRIRRTGEIATIEEVELIRWCGEVKKYCHLKIEDDQRHLWMLSDELAEVVEHCTAVFRPNDGRDEVRLGISMNWKTHSADVHVPADLLREDKDGSMPPFYRMAALEMLLSMRDNWGEPRVVID